MCRLAAFPPHYPRDKALEVMKDMAGHNRDGVGSCYVRPDGKFELCRHPGDLDSLLSSEHKDKFLAHMPYDGWTIVHLRFGTHGGNTYENTHPFVVGEWAVVHNGVWMGYAGAKFRLKDALKLKGDTESEVAANLMSMYGPVKFMKEVKFGGVFLALNRNGSLWACKTSGELVRSVGDEPMILSSELSKKHKAKWIENGRYRYNKLGKLTSKADTPETLFEGYGNWLKKEWPKPVQEPAKRFGANVYEFSSGSIKAFSAGVLGRREVIVPRDPGVVPSEEIPRSDPDMMDEDGWKAAYSVD